MTYIKQAIDIINALGRYDFNEYSQLVYYVLKQSLKDKNRIVFLGKLLNFPATSNLVVAYKKAIPAEGLDPDQIDDKDIIFTSSINTLQPGEELIIDLSSQKEIIDNNFALLCMIAAEKTTKIKKSSDQLSINDIDILKSMVGSQPFILTRLISACVKKSQGEDSKSKFFSAFSTYKAITVYAYLIKSILVGEFLSLDDFSEQLRTILQKGLNSPDDDAKEDRFVPPILNLVENIIHEYTRFCKQKSLLYHKGHEVGITPYYYGLEEKEAIYKLTEVDATLINLHILFQFALKITAIDLCYYATENNLQILIDALFHNYRIKQYLNNQYIPQGINLLRAVNPDIYDLMQDVILGIEFKAGALAYGILEEKKWDKEEISIDGHNYVIAGYSDIRVILNKYRYVKQIDNPITAYYYQKHSNHWYFEYTIKHSYPYENHNDIKTYDTHIEEAYKTYFEEQELVKQIVSATNEQDIIPIISTIENIAKKDSINHTPGFFPLLISSINKKINNGDLDINLYNKCFHAYRILLRVLRNYIQTYKDQDRNPLQFRPLFYNSFYTYQREADHWVYAKNYYEIERDSINSQPLISNTNRNKSVFFASYQYDPIDIQYLENFFFEFNNKWHEIQEKRMTEQINTMDTLSKKNKEIRPQIIELFADERKRTIQLLGIFGAMLAFVSSVVGMQKIVETPAEFALFAFTYILGLLIFVVAIHHVIIRHHKIVRNNQLAQQNRQDNQARQNCKPITRNIWHPIWIIILALIICCGLIYYSETTKSECTDESKSLIFKIEHIQD